MTDTQQRTFDGGVADPYERPETLLYCNDCDKYVLRSQRHDHAVVTRDELDETNENKYEETTLTSQYLIEFESLHREVIDVEAQNEYEAREKARRHREFNGDFIETLYVTTEMETDPSQASVDYSMQY